MTRYETEGSDRALTGLSDPTVKRAFLETGADLSLPEPVELQPLLDGVSPPR